MELTISAVAGGGSWALVRRPDCENAATSASQVCSDRMVVS